MNHLMLDLETLDNLPTSVILSIGAVFFDPITGKLGREFYRVIDAQTAIDAGLTVSASTVYWWMKQTQEARETLFREDNLEPLRSALVDFVEFTETEMECNVKHIRLWGNDPSFDNAILRHANHKLKVELKIPFWNTRCVRTVLGFYPPQLFRAWKDKHPRTGAYHNALDDAKYQAKYVSHILSELGVEDLY